MQNISEKSVAQSVLPWFIFGVAALFYCYAYFLRVSPGMMSTEIQQHFHITAKNFGIFTTLYYIAYAPMQLLVGSIIDRYGARFVLFSACLVCLSGVYLFGSATNFYLACFARFMIGLGSAFGYVTILKVASIWLPPKRFAAAAGLTTAFGMVAAIFTENYLAKAVAQSGFHESLTSSLLAGVILSGLIVAVIRNRPKTAYESTNPTSDRISTQELKAGYLRIIKNPQTWYIGLVGALLYIPAMVFLDVYAPSYLNAAYHLDKSQAAHIISAMFGGWIIGAPLIGAISDHIKKRKLPLIVASISATVMICTIFYVPNLPIPLIYAAMITLGFSCGAHPLVFSLGKENSPIKFSGTATAVTNFFVMTGGLVLFLVGHLLDWHWNGQMLQGAPLYTLSDYNFALAVIPVGLISALFLATLIKETGAQTKNDWDEASTSDTEAQLELGLELDTQEA